MSELSAFLTARMDEALDVMGEPCTIDGTSCNGVFSRIMVSTDMTETAYAPAGDSTVSVSKTDFATSPNNRATVVRSNTNYTIINIEENDSGWVLELIKEV